MRILVAIYSEFQSWCIPEVQLDALRALFPEHTFVRADSDEEVLDRIRDADAVFGSRVTRDQFLAAPRLRWVHSNAAGIGSMLFPEMVRSDVVMTNSRGNSSVTIAEHVIAVTLALLRDLPLAWRRQSEKVWAQNEFNSGAFIRTLRGARVLVIGLGSIGSETAKLASGFGAQVAAIRRRPDAPRPSGVHEIHAPADLHAQLPHADVVVISAPQTTATVRLIGERELALMKDDAVLVNVSRGKLIDETALVRALETGRLRGAALDVFEHEPLDPASPLWNRPDVLITPHVSGFHAEYWTQVIRLFADNLRRFVAGEPLANVVDKTAGY